MAPLVLRICGSVVAIAIGTTPATPFAMGPAVEESNPVARARELNGEGQAHFDAGSYAEAARSWSAILRILPENTANRAERENSLLIALEAYKEAYNSVRGMPGRPVGEAIVYLRRAVAVHEEYVAAYATAYGADQPVSTSVRSAGEWVRRMLAEAEAELPKKDARDPPPAPVPTKDVLVLDRTPVKRGPSGTGLIVTGAVLAGVGLGMISLIIVGGVRGRDARREQRAARDDMDADAEEEADRKGKSANALIISGSVLTAVFLGTGATLLGIGIHRRRRYQALHPLLGPHFVGIGATTRF